MMKVSECVKCKFYQRRVWTRYYKPLNYHAIGNNHAYGYCTAYDKRCFNVRKCDMRGEENAND